MPATATTAAPFIIQKPIIKIGATGSEVSIECATSQLSIEVDQDENTVETFCGSYTGFKAPKWTITATIAQSYGAAGSWTLIQPLCGTVQKFVVQPGQAAPSIDNPVMSGTALLKWLPFIDAGPGEASEVDLVMAVQGLPVFGITAPLMADEPE